MDKKDFDEIFSAIYLRRPDESLKSDFGPCLLIGGSAKYPNAITIASDLCVLSGVSYIGILTPKSAYPAVSKRAPLMCIYEDVPSSDDAIVIEDERRFFKLINSYKSILIGNGMNFSCEENVKLLSLLFIHYRGVLIIDASALRALKGVLSILKRKNSELQVLLTPHLNEAKYLLDSDIDSRDCMSYLSEARRFSKEYNCRILLKSWESILVTPSFCYPCSYKACAALAKAGSGDGLAGYITGLASYLTREYSFDDVILFADELIHLLAKKAGERTSTALASVLSLEQELIDLIQEKKRGL